MVGKLKAPRNWPLGYYYANTETLAVNASFAQDDWFRFGGKDDQTDSSDYKGHEIRLACTILENLNLVSRLYTVYTLTSYQRGNRFLMDLNWGFFRLRITDILRCNFGELLRNYRLGF